MNYLLFTSKINYIHQSYQQSIFIIQQWSPVPNGQSNRTLGEECELHERNKKKVLKQLLISFSNKQSIESGNRVQPKWMLQWRQAVHTSSTVSISKIHSKQSRCSSASLLPTCTSSSRPSTARWCWSHLQTKSAVSHTIQLLDTMHNLVDVLPHDVLDIDQVLIDLVVSI